VKIGEIERTHIVFYSKIHSLPLTFNDDRGSERPELAGSKMALIFLEGASEFGDSCTPQIWVKTGVFFQRSSFWEIGGLGCLAMIV
jgi:hypothetical protein